MLLATAAKNDILYLVLDTLIFEVMYKFVQFPFLMSPQVYKKFICATVPPLLESNAAPSRRCPPQSKL